MKLFGHNNAIARMWIRSGDSVKWYSIAVRSHTMSKRMAFHYSDSLPFAGALCRTHFDLLIN